MQGVYCKNETKANDHGDGNGGEELKADEDHSEGGALKKLAKKVKAKSKMARAHKKIASAGANKKKLKKKLKAHEKLAAAKARQHAAAARKGDDDGAVSFLQYEAATRDAAALQPHGLSLLLKKLASSSSDGEDEGEDEEGEDEEDWCDPTVQEAAFKEVDAGGDGASGDGEVDAQEMTDFAEEEGMSAEEAAGVFAMMDTNGDGKVTLDEWKAAINMFAKCDEEAAHTTNVKAHSEGGALKKLAKKVKAKSKMARAHKKIASAGANKKKLKKKLKAHEKLAAAKARQHAAAARKGDDDGAVSFLQYEAATRDAAALQPHGLSLLLKKLASSSSDGEDEGEDEEGEDEEDWCDPTVQEAAFKEVDAGGDGASGDGEVDAQEMTDFAEEEGMSAEEAAGVFAMMDTNGDGKVTLDEWKAAINMFAKCDEEAAHTTNLKAHTQGGGKKKLKKKLKAMEKKAEARRKQESNAHAKKMIKKKIKAAEKIAEAKERKDAAAARKPAEQDGDDGKDVKAR